MEGAAVLTGPVNITVFGALSGHVPRGKLNPCGLPGASEPASATRLVIGGAPMHGAWAGWISPILELPYICRSVAEPSSECRGRPIAPFDFGPD